MSSSPKGNVSMPELVCAASSLVLMHHMSDLQYMKGLLI